jgi:hypothetical protein
MAQELRNVARRQLLSNERLTLIVGHGADLLRESAPTRRIRRSLRYLLRQGFRTRTL